MHKKEYVLKVLDAVKDVWEMAPGLKILVENNAIDDKVIDTLVGLFREAAAKTTNKQAKVALEKSATLVGNLHEKEELSHEADLTDLADLEDMFKNM